MQSEESDSKFGYLSWLNKHIELAQTNDILFEKKPSIDVIKEGLIVDAQDYLDKWYLGIICKIQPKNEQEYLKVNFLPYPKGNRDEWISKSEMPNRISGPFTNAEFVNDGESIVKNIEGLRHYFSEKFLAPSTGSQSNKNNKNQGNGKSKGK